MQRPAPGRIVLDARTAGDHGIGRYVDELARWLPELAPDLRYTVIRRDDPMEGRSPWKNLRTAVVPVPPYSLAEQIAIPAWARRERPALLHVPTFGAPALPLPCPLVLTIFDLIHLDDPRPLRRHRNALYFRHIVRRAAHRAARVLTASAHAKARLVARLGLPEGRVEVIPLGSSFSGPPRDPPPPDAPFLALVQPRPHRNVANLVRGYADLVDRFPAAPPLCLVGEPGPGPRSIIRGTPGLAERIRILPHPDDAVLGRLYREASALIAPAHDTGTGLPVLEAMACGTPVVVADSPPLLDLVSSSGTFFQAEHPESIANALLRLLQDPGEWKERSDAARARTGDRSWRGTAEATLAVYREVFSESTPP